MAEMLRNYKQLLHLYPSSSGNCSRLHFALPTLNALALIPYLCFCPVVWYLDRFALTLHATLSLASYFRYQPAWGSLKNLGCTRLSPWARVSNLCTQRRTSRPDLSPYEQDPLSYYVSFCGPRCRSFQAPQYMCTFVWCMVLGFNLCYSGNAKVKTSSMAHQNIRTIFPRFGNRDFWWG